MASSTKKSLPAKTTRARFDAGSRDVLDMPPDVLGRLVDQVIAEVSASLARLPGLATLSNDERIHSNGRLRDGEPEAMTAILDTADSRPAYFLPLAARDRGADENRFETGPCRDDLARRAHVERLRAALEPNFNRVGDTVLALGSRIRDVTMPAYALARVASAHDGKLREKLNPATDFFSAPHRKRARAAQGTKGKKAGKGADRPE